MAEAKLTIDIDVDGVGKAVTGLASVNKAIKSIDSRQRGLASTSSATTQMMTTSTLKLKKHFDQFDKVVKTVGTIGLKGLTMTLKFATIEMVAMGAAMVAIHGAFVLGNAAMRAMRATLGPLAAGMTAVVAAASAAAAAIREQQAAMYAYKNNAAPQFGSGLNQARMVMRGLHTDVELASVGVENLNKAYATVSKTSTFTGRSQVLLKGLMDFASAGQPIEEGIQKAADLIALLQDSKKSFSEAKASAQQLFPDKNAMDKAFKDLKITTKKGLEKAITTGELSKAANVEGQFEAVSGTLINRLKGYFNIIKNQFGDLGQPLLEPVKKAAYQIFNILRRGFVKISGNTQKFGMTSMLEGLVNMVDKLTTWSTNLINENIQSVDGMFSKMAGWWKDFRYGWNEVLDRLRPFIDGARVIEKMFGEVWKHVKNVVSSGFGQFNEWLVQNEATVIEFGGKVGDLITSIMKFQQEMKKILQDLMPFINDVVGGIAAMVDQMTGFIKLLRNLTGGGTIGALASLLAVRGMFGAMKGTKGGWLAKQTITTQPINAQQVILNTPSVVTGGGNLGTTGALMRGAGGGAGLASAGGAGLAGAGGGMVILPSGRVIPGGGGGGGGISGGGGFITTTGPSGPSSPLHRPLVGQPGYVPPSGRFQKFRDWEYRNFMTAGPSDEDLMKTRAMRTNKSGNLTFRAKMAQREMALRAARSGDNQAVGYRRLGKFQDSAGAKMGTSLALGAMSQFAPEEAQGALALGGAVSMINPLAGIGVAGLGTALKSETAAGGLISGAGGGAALGAMIGTMGGPIGAGAGAAIGAILGGVSGAVMGSINRSRKQAKEAKQAASEVTQSIMNNVLSGVLDETRKETGVGKTALRTALSNTMQKQGRGLTAINKALDLAKTGNTANPIEIAKGQRAALQQFYDAQNFYGMTISKDQLEKMLKKPAAALSKMQKEIETGQKAMGPIQEKYNNRMDQLQKITGKSDQEINALAKTMGVNLMDGTKDFMKVLEELGLMTIRTADQMRASVADSYVNALKGFDKEIDAIKAPQILDETAESLRRLYDAQGGKITEVQSLQFVSDAMEQMLTLYGGDAMKAYTQAQTSFKKGGTAFTDPNSPFYKTNMNLLDNEKVQGILEKFRADAGLDYGAQLNSKLLGMGGSIDVNKFQEQWKKMTADQQLKASQVLENGIGTGPAAMRLIDQAGSPAQALLNAAGFGNLKIGKAETAGTKEIDLAKASKDIVDSTSKIIKQMEIYFTQANEAVPAWYTKESFEKLMGGDTSTPRGQAFGDTTSSRLSQTMARHASMNGMLTGKRTVTSGYRNFGLGSMNSDHVTGRAYDLVGQNLGQYQSLVKATGGFAEFHGVNGARHLHVVPGSGAIGDRRVPVMGGAMGPTVQMSGGGGGNNYNFYVSGNQNASANEIAEIVVQKVKEIERSNRERR